METDSGHGHGHGHGARRRRGAVMVEGLIAITLLSLFLACTVFVHGLYASKLVTIVQARSAAWSSDQLACGGGLIAGVLDSLGLISALSEADNRDLIDAPEWVTDMGRSVGDSDPRDVGMGELLGGRVFHLRTSTSVPCNEFAEDDDGSLVLNLFRAVRQIVPIEFD
jgi:hypothetical protein